MNRRSDAGMTYLPFQSSSGRNVNRIDRLRKDMFRSSGKGLGHDEERASPPLPFFFGTRFSFAKDKKKRKNV